MMLLSKQTWSGWQLAAVSTLLLLALAAWAAAEETTFPGAPAADTDESSAEGSTLQDEPLAGSGCPHCRRGQGDSGVYGRGCRGRGTGAGHRRGDPGGPPPEMELAHLLIDHHGEVSRAVEMIADGVRTRTTADDPELVAALRSHVRQMAALLEDGGRVRNWDPLFAEIFDRRELIEIHIEDIEGGVEVVETSADPSVVQLVQAHARKVDEFVERGREACHEATPIPADYEQTGS